LTTSLLGTGGVEQDDFREECKAQLEEPVMPRLARLPSIPFGWYYVALHGVPNRKIITSRAELRSMLKLLRATLRQRDARLHAGYIAEHEAHFALQAGEGRLSLITGSFQHEYARLFNRAHHEHGSLFRLHHHELLIQHQKYLVPLTHYIHWIRRLEAPHDYQQGLWWSSDSIYRGSKKKDWVTTNVVLRMLTRGAYSREVQEEAYRKLFDQAPPRSYTCFFRHGSARDPRLLGDDEFIEDVSLKTGRRSLDRIRHARDSKGDIPGVVMQVIEQFNALCEQRLFRVRAATWTRIVQYENVRSRSRKRPLPMVRTLSASYLVEHKIATPTQAARFFGYGPRSVSAQRRRFYEARFREFFGAGPEILFCPLLCGRKGEKKNSQLSADSGGSDLVRPRSAK
jgi:hypothetical protein